MAITYDLDGSQFTAGEQGDTWQRRYMVTGLLQASIPDRIVEAYAQIPDTGTAAPIPNMYLRSATLEEFVCEDESIPSWRAFGTIIYSTPTNVGGATYGVPDDNGPGITVQSSATVREVTVDKDRGGVTIETTFDGVTMAHELNGFATDDSLVFERIESTHPRARQATHRGTLNSALWNGYAAETVLCLSIECDTDDLAASYRVVYSFAVRAEGWAQSIVHEDPMFPGKPLPQSLRDANSAKTFDTIPTSNFGALNITLP